MASWNTHGRDPLLDSNLQSLLNKRGRELLGLALIVLGGFFALILGSYAPDDPGWMASSQMPVQNSLGRIGAAIASPLMIILGVAAWGLAAFFAGWGLRLIVGRGHEQALARAVFVPIALAVTSVWCATLVPSAGWDTVFGMGGLFGDTVLGAVVNALPMSASAGVTFMGVAMLFVALAVWAYVLGVNRFELMAFLRFVVAGVILCYAGVLAVLRGGLGSGAVGMRVAGSAVARKVQAGREAQAAARAQRQARAQEPMLHHDMHHGYEPQIQHPAHHPAAPRRSPPVIRAKGYEPPVQSYVTDPEDDYPLYESPAPKPEPRMRSSRAPVAQHAEQTEAPQEYIPFEPADYADVPMYDETPQSTGLLAKLKALSGRPVEQTTPDLRGELVEPPLSAAAMSAQPAGDARIKSRIADAIRHRKAVKPVLQMRRTQPQMSEPPLRAAPAVSVQDHEVPAPQVSLQANISAPMGIVPMPDWMVAAQPTPAQQEPAPAAPPYPSYEPEDDVIYEETAYHGAAADPVAQEAPRTSHVLQRRVIATGQRRVQPSRKAQAEAEPAFQFEKSPVAEFELPPLSLLESPSQVERFTLSDEALEENARMLENVLDDYGVRGEIVSVRPGPVVTQYELEPAPGLKASRVIGLADDIARSMSALSARVSTVPGRSIIGIELPNLHREKVVLREILGARDYGDSNMRLPLALGKAIDGEPIVANLAKMPHLLIAGTTGSGKSVAINTMILSLLYRLPPEECRMIMIDPKMLELSVYDGIPHLLSPVVTDPKKAVVALKWVVGEMEERYRKMSKMGVRNIEGYNGRVREALERGEMFKRTIQTGFDDETGDPVFETEEFAPELLPFIVVVVDEMADLMMVAGKEIEACIQRLAQMARASGIHLIMATQRPSVDVITGTIKANFPTRISFQVTSKIDSRTILGEQGAEQLLGMGDMLYMAGGGRVSRIHGPFVSDEEVEEVVNHLKSFGPPDYKSGVVDGPEQDREADIDAVLGLGGNTTGEDALYDQAVQVIIQDRKCSTSYIQRKLGIGYNKAARLVEQMEDEGLVTPANHVGKREILVPEQG